MTPIVVLAFSLILIPVLILAWDLYLYQDEVEGNSISQSIVYFSKKYPILPACMGLGIGFLCGHFWG